MLINYVLRGEGKPLLLVHGLGGSWRSWQLVLGALASQRSVVAIDLPGFGKSPPLDGDVTMRTMADALQQFLHEHELVGTDAVGSSVGARVLHELSNREGTLGSVVMLGPCGFWSDWDCRLYCTSAWLTMHLMRSLQFAVPKLTDTEWTRKLLFARCSAKAATLAPALVLREMRSFATAASLGPVLRDLLSGLPIEGASSSGMTKPPVFGWGRLDRTCHPRQASRAQQLFPDARMHWFEGCGHFPHWDAPEETTRLILDVTSE
ncbi:MAG: alpha/beta fold hydrolase [Gammaproteobacteria bacterium]|nr:alpha/beta fold hydrolase [Gammaproteobacteria bacterium]MBU1443056.1 alpha/beta fold hydrolase [Gammaproteobacteria bacterium]MBU2286693.1 alpha/beta fold hydrolase [Gammaproteobacteria bacterium]